MSFRKRVGGGKRDLAEKPICQMLDQVGAQYWLLSGTGNPDILVRFRRRFYAAEIKTGNGKETENQGDFPIWRTPEDALLGIGCKWREDVDVCANCAKALTHFGEVFTTDDDVDLCEDCYKLVPTR